MPEKPTAAFLDLVEFSESFLERYGPDSARGVGDFGDDYVAAHRVLLDVIRESAGPVSLLDFGCGLSALNDLIVAEGRDDIIYSGLEVSPRFLDEARRKYPDADFYRTDVLTDAFDDLPEFDYVIMSGIFHYRGSRSEDEMSRYMQALVARMFSKARVGLAFNTITKQVEWERDDLFHVPVDRLLTFLSREVSRHVTIRHDYGLYEFTTYVYREPSERSGTDVQPLLRDGVSGPDG